MRLTAKERATENQRSPLDDRSRKRRGTDQARYVKKVPANLEQHLFEALATSTGECRSQLMIEKQAH